MRTRSGGIAARTLIACIVVAALVSAVLVALLFAVARANRSLDRQSHAKEMAVAAVQVEGTVGDLDATLRAYALTRSGRFVASWRRARSDLVREQSQLAKLARGDRAERRAVATISADVSSYLDEWAQPLFSIAQVAPAVASSPTAQLEDKRRVDGIRADVQRLLAFEDARAAATARSVHSSATQAIGVGATVLVACVLAILLFGSYLVSAVAQPLRRAAAAAGEVATGRFSERLPERGPGEVADLARAFNAMARSLDEGRRELLHQNELLTQAERHQSELISIVSHEVRTPLASLLGFTDLLLRRELDPQTQRRYLEILHQESRRLASLTTDFLDVRLLEEGRLELARTRVDAARVAREQAHVFVSGSERHALSLEVPDEPLWVEADRDRLSQVVGNLVANAIKYSPDGGEVLVRAFARDGRVTLEVTDHGLGIPLEDQPLIFTKFYRGHAAGSGIPGTGLGLAIAHELVRAHGGDLTFDSEFGRGTTFRLELPAARDAEGGGRTHTPRGEPDFESGASASSATSASPHILDRVGAHPSSRARGPVAAVTKKL